MRPIAAAVFCLLILAGSPAHVIAQTAPLDECLIRYRALRDSVFAEAMSTQSICTTFLANGLALGLWNEEEARFEEKRIEAIFEAPAPLYVPIPDAQIQFGTVRLSQTVTQAHAPTPYDVMSRAVKPFDVSTATSPLATWLAARMRCLTLLRSEADLGFCRAAVERAEEIWLTARDEADLQPAREILNEALGRAGGASSTSAMRRRSARNQTLYIRSVDPASDVAADVVDAFGVISSPKAIFFHEPEVDPAEFAGTRILWAALREIKHRSLQHPRVATRIASLDTHFLPACRAADEALDQAILRNVPPAEFEPLWQRAMAFRSPRLPKFEPHGLTPFQSSSASIDYQYWIENQVTNLQNLQKASPPPQSGTLLTNPPRISTAYKKWLRWRMAEAENHPGEAAQARQDLRNALAEFPSAVAESAAAQLGPQIPPAAQLAASAFLPPRGDDAEKNLIAALQAVKANVRSINTGELIEAWQHIKSPSPQPILEQRDFTQSWSEIISNPLLLPLIDLRDAVGRIVLTRLLAPGAASPEPNVPVSTLIRQEFERACINDDLALASRLLALDAAGSFLLRDEWMRYTQELAALTSARDFTTHHQLDRAQIAYAQILRSTTSLDFAARIAREMKAIDRSRSEAPGNR